MKALAWAETFGNDSLVTAFRFYCLVEFSIPEKVKSLWHHIWMLLHISLAKISDTRDRVCPAKFEQKFTLHDIRTTIPSFMTSYRQIYHEQRHSKTINNRLLYHNAWVFPLMWLGEYITKTPH